ncbi:putative transport protein [Symbiodinium microadriaticum]|uniref:Putative transport protein n=1 Tax=Symbiodinium microadriaticum TaxID=2951 RepID=A0A1Q9F5K1_SYMMI|nr:putative transport protein [Symbiodinium microadriaticum]
MASASPRHERAQTEMAGGQRKSLPRCSGRLRGVLLSIAAAASFALAAMLVKDVLWGRAIVQTGIIGSFFLARCESPWGPAHLRGWLALRGILGCCAIVGYFVGIIALPLADSISIYSVKPIFAALLGACVLGEALGFIHVFATGLSLLGCILVAKDEAAGHHSSKHEDLYLDPAVAVIVLLFAALFAAGTSISTRKVMAGTTVRAEVPVWYFCFMDLLLLSVRSFASEGAVPQAVKVLGQQWFTLGLRHIPSALSTLLVQTETIDAFLLQVIFFGRVGLLSILGASLIAAGTATLATAELRGGSSVLDARVCERTYSGCTGMVLPRIPAKMARQTVAIGGEVHAATVVTAVTATAVMHEEAPAAAAKMRKRTLPPLTARQMSKHHPGLRLSGARLRNRSLSSGINKALATLKKL